MTKPGTWTTDLLMLGQFHFNEVSAQTGEVWLGLFPTDTGFELRPTALTIVPFDDVLAERDRSGVQDRWLLIAIGYERVLN